MNAIKTLCFSLALFAFLFVCACSRGTAPAEPAPVAPAPAPAPVVEPAPTPPLPTPPKPVAQKAPTPPPVPAPAPVPPADDLPQLGGDLSALLGSLAGGTNDNAEAAEDLAGLVSGIMSQLNIEATPDGTVKINGSEIDPAAALEEMQKSAENGAPPAFLEGLFKPEQMEALRKQAENLQPSPAQMEQLEKMRESFQGLPVPAPPAPAPAK